MGGDSLPTGGPDLHGAAAAAYLFLPLPRREERKRRIFCSEQRKLETEMKRK
jgi:hypothetical protein